MELLYPVGKDAIVTQTYREHQANAPRLNAGMDWGIPAGTPVRAAAGGRVVLTYYDQTGYGNVVKLDHSNGDATLYAHLSKSQVIPGQPVRTGEILGFSGNTGNSTGPHLHFEYRQKNKPVDPAPYLVTSPQPSPEGKGVNKPVLFKAAVGVDELNIRSGPGTQYAILGKLKRGDLVEVCALDGLTVWGELPGGRWVALRWGGEEYVTP
jgi:uncharacterized protein YgiM (DUF1202 family)